MVHKPGRNDPCPCKSGKKFKSCCGQPGGRSVEAVAAELRLAWPTLENYRVRLRQADARATTIRKLATERGIAQGEIAPILALCCATADLPPIRSMALESFERFAPWERTLHYWGELDSVASWVLVRTRLLLADALVDLITKPPHSMDAPKLRQTIELATWSAFYVFGLVWSGNVLGTQLQGKKFAYAMCGPIETFVRGAVAPSDRRSEAGRLALGLTSARAAEPGVNELNATFAKQQAVVREMIRVRGRTHSIGSLQNDFEILQDSYDYLCGLTHITPVLLIGSEEERYAAILKVTLETLPRFLESTTFHPKSDSPFFLETVLPHVDPNSREVLNLEFKALTELATANASVELALRTGGTLTLYDSRAKRGRKPVT